SPIDPVSRPEILLHEIKQEIRLGRIVLVESGSADPGLGRDLFERNITDSVTLEALAGPAPDPGACEQLVLLPQAGLPNALASHERLICHDCSAEMMRVGRRGRSSAASRRASVQAGRPKWNARAASGPVIT